MKTLNFLIRHFVMALMSTFVLQPSSFGNEPQKVVILWADLGNGHLSAAHALEKLMVQNLGTEVSVSLINVSEYQDPGFRQINQRAFTFTSKYLGEIYNGWFEALLELAESRNREEIPLNYLNINEEKLWDKIRAEDPKLILSTFNHATEILIRLRARGWLSVSIPVVWQHTDYIDRRYYAEIASKIDLTLTPHSDISEKWVREGWVPSAKLLSSGIPVDQSILEASPAAKSSPRHLANSRSGWKNPARPSLLLFSGANGVGPFETYVREIAKNWPSDQELEINAVCGRNAANYKDLQRLQRTLPEHIKLSVHGFIDMKWVREFITQADLVVGKAGGLTITEGLTLGTPMLLLDINGGQERYNVSFFQRTGLGLGSYSTRDVAPLVVRTLLDHNRRMQIRKAGLEVAVSNAKNSTLLIHKLQDLLLLNQDPFFRDSLLGHAEEVPPSEWSCEGAFLKILWNYTTSPFRGR